MSKKIQPIKTDQLQNIVKDSRKIINDYIEKNNMSVHGFAVLTGVHPNQMYLFLNADRGLNLTTLEKIGKIISKN